MQRLRRKRRRTKEILLLPVTISMVIVFVATLKMCSGNVSLNDKGTKTNQQAVSFEPALTTREVVSSFASGHNLSIEDYPDRILAMLENNSETKNFVLNYPLKKDIRNEVFLDEYQNCKQVPLLMQWDERWGYHKYGADVMGLTGCGPTCLSMVAIYLLHNTDYNPVYMADFSARNGYCINGSGTAWDFMSAGAKKLGLKVTELPLDKNKVIRNLQEGHPVICVMGPGDFTKTGHFIVMTGCENGKIKINDPNSRSRSEMLWDFDAIQSQIRNLWAYSV